MSFEPDVEARARIEKLSAWLGSVIPEAFALEAIRRPDGSYDPNVLDREAGYAVVCERIRSDFDENELERSVAEFAVYPSTTGFMEDDNWPLRELPLYVCARMAREARSLYALQLYTKRLEYMLKHPLLGTECEVSSTSQSLAGCYHAPWAEDCVEFLAAFADEPEALPAIRSLVTGDWNVLPPLAAPEGVREDYGLDQSSYERVGHKIYHVELLRALFTHGELGYEEFARAVDQNPSVLHEQDFEPRDSWTWTAKEDETRVWGKASEAGPFEHAMSEYALRLVYEVSEELDRRAFRVFTEVRWKRPIGTKFLLRACRHVESLGLKKVPVSSYDDIEQAIRYLVGIKKLAPDETAEGLVRDLRDFAPSTLKVVLPHAGAATDIVMQALGWESVIPLQGLVRELAGKWGSDVENSTDPTSGVVDRDAVLGCLSRIDEKRAKAWMAVMKSSKAPMQKTLTLVQACAGWNRAEVVRKIDRLEQIALKAFGLLPIENGADEVLERYQRLRQASREASRFGVERTGNVRGAVKAGLANLATNAGYRDPVRLEWAMEAKLAAETSIGEEHRLGEWKLRLELTADGPSIAIEKQGKRLKSVPKGILKSKAYLELKAAKAELKSQATRYRASLEELMTFADTMTDDELREISRLPTLRDYLQSLVLASGGCFGTYDPDGHELVGLRGERLPLAAETSLAHAFHLQAAGSLQRWQEEIVSREVVQPFKQVFRELYVLTPEEVAAERLSNRFAGHPLDPRIASRLLQSRGWSLGSDDESPSRAFYRLNLFAHFVFPDAGPHFLAETDVITSGEIVFTTTASSPIPCGEHGQVRLADVPPLVFSEVMRDCDLVVSVAQLAEDDVLLFSPESFATRTDLLRALIPKLGLEGVRIDGHFARIQGTRAQYRVHLGTGTILIEKGDALSVVPAKALQRELVFLPFAPMEDPKAAEVISKVEILAHDEAIDDPVLLKQIERRAR